MTILTVRHLTTYRYRQAVSFGEHRLMLRPRGCHDQRLLETSLAIHPEPSELRWSLDAFGNSVARARFSRRARELSVESRLRIDHAAQDLDEAAIEPYARTLPFAYGAEDVPDLARSIERGWPDPARAVDAWARGFLAADGPTSTCALLAGMARAIRRHFTYLARHEHGVQAPSLTLHLSSGTCRDFAVLMMEAARALGLAARFVSGYLYVPARDRAAGDGGGYLGGGSTHAWTQVFLPGAGWVDFDPTNAIVGSRDLIRVAAVREPRQAVPLSGSWTGAPLDSLGMEVSVEVRAEPDPEPALRPQPPLPAAPVPAPAAARPG